MTAYELKQERLSFETNRMATLVYKDVQLKSRYYLDIVVEGLIALELKSIATLLGIHKKQLLTQLRLTNLPVGLLINFNVELLTGAGVRRVINPRYKSAATKTPT